MQNASIESTHTQIMQVKLCDVHISEGSSLSLYSLDRDLWPPVRRLGNVD